MDGHDIRLQYSLFVRVEKVALMSVIYRGAKFRCPFNDGMKFSYARGTDVARCVTCSGTSKFLCFQTSRPVEARFYRDK